MLTLNSDYSIESELYNIIRLFYDIDKIDLNVDCCFCQQSPYISINGEYFYIYLDRTLDKKFSRVCKTALYKVLCAYTGKSFAWGALTGVRPTKLAYELIENHEDIIDGLKKYGVSEQKAELIKRIVNNQNGFSRSLKKVNFYVHIPFCTSRCNYCSFVSLPVKNNEEIMSKYVDFLCKEIISGSELINRLGYEVDSVYIGGGTPTALDSYQLKRVLNAIPYRNIEFTVEAGRPDTITLEKLEVMSEYGVSRISINPQSFSDKTLKAIGRNHSSQDILKVYDLAKDKFIINMDIIAGLSQETLFDFEYTLNMVKKLRPENITVHTLAKKNGSVIKNNNETNAQGVAQMVDLALESLTKEGYEPYYLYRQKNMIENLENIGYALPGTICANNVTTMEEFYSVFACGAGAISKRLFDNGRIERYANLRDVKLYIDQFDDRLEKKTKFFS